MEDGIDQDSDFVTVLERVICDLSQAQPGKCLDEYPAECLEEMLTLGTLPLEGSSKNRMISEAMRRSIGLKNESDPFPELQSALREIVMAISGDSDDPDRIRGLLALCQELARLKDLPMEEIPPQFQLPL